MTPLQGQRVAAHQSSLGGCQFQHHRSRRDHGPVRPTQMTRRSLALPWHRHPPQLSRARPFRSLLALPLPPSPLLLALSSLTSSLLPVVPLLRLFRIQRLPLLLLRLLPRPLILHLLLSLVLPAPNHPPPWRVPKSPLANLARPKLPPQTMCRALPLVPTLAWPNPRPTIRASATHSSPV